MEGGNGKWILKEKKRTGQMWVLPHFLWGAPHQEAGRGCREQCLGLDELSEAAVARGSLGTTLQAYSALFSVTSGRRVHSFCSIESQGSLPRLPQECQAVPGVWVVFTKQTPPYLDGNRLRIFWVTLSPPGRKHLDRLLIQAEIWWTQIVVFGGEEFFNKSSSWLSDLKNGVKESNPTLWQGNK